MPELSEIEDAVRVIVADAADLPPGRIGLDDNLFTELGVDSLGTVAIYVDLSYRFGLPEPVDEESFRALDTLRKLVERVRAHLGEPP